MLHFFLFATAIFSISDRDNFWDVEHLSPKTQYGETNEQGITKLLSDSQISDFWTKLENKRVLFLIHGFSSTTPYINYHNIRVNIENLFLRVPYDYVIGYFWPCYDDFYEYYVAKQMIEPVVPRLMSILEKTQKLSTTVDVIAHSMGNRLLFETLNALAQKEQTPCIRNIFSWAAAVDNEALEPGEVYNPALTAIENVYIFFSRKDDVLKWAYSASEFDRALGYSGAEDPAKLPENVEMIDCTDQVNDHSAYMLSRSVYEQIKEKKETSEDLEAE